MHATSYATKLILSFGAALLLAAPSYAQTLNASASAITIGQVINCNNSQTLSLTSSGGAITFTAAITYPAGDIYGTWLYATDVSNTHSTNGYDAPITVTVPSNGTASLRVGLNAQIGVSDTATLTLTTTSPTGQTLTIPVTLNSGLGCPGLTVNNGTLTAIPASLQLAAAQGQSSTQDTIVTNLSASPVTFSAGASPFFPWLSTTFGTVTLQAGQSIAVPITASAGSLAPGSYTGTVVISYGPNQLTALFVNVTLTVSANGAAPGIVTGVRVSTNALNFNWVPGNAKPATQTVIVSNQVGTNPIPLTLAVTQYNGPPNWLATTYAAGAQTAYPLTVSVNALGLTPGVTYQGTLTIEPYLGPAVEIYVSLAVTTAPVVTATPTSLTFTAAQGGPAPAAQQVVVTGGGNVVEYSTAAPIPGWLSAYAPTGSAPNGGLPYFSPGGGGTWLNVLVNQAGLNPGTYTGTLTVYGDGPAVGNTNIAVTLIVTGPAVQSMSNSASYAADAVAPGEMVTLFSTDTGDFGPASGVALTADLIVNNMLPTTLGGVQVLFNGTAAPLIYAGARQINTIVPYEIAGSANVSVTVKYNGQTSAPFSVPTAAAQPALFTSTATGAGQGAAGQYDVLGNYQGVNSGDNPVTRGGILTLYATGEGRTAGSVTGGITSAKSAAPYTPQPQFAPAVLIDGQPATVVFYGEVPGVVAGMMQINVIVPPGVRAGNVPVSISMGTFYSQAGVTVAAK
ncbi:MAG TPA: hypothetical protein VHW09_14830 [Bryobacteraceae bacterium]|jgi:uncharacterized protein (TIGR03437 family)|nr:hypothetical protein [Bryobacteraceae bacterium]